MSSLIVRHGLSHPDSKGSTRGNYCMSLNGFQFSKTQPRIRKEFGTLARLKNETPTQPMKHTKLYKNSYYPKFYQKFDRISFVIWPTPCQGKTIYIHISSIDLSMGYPSRNSAKIHPENKNTIHRLSNYVGETKDIHIDQ